MIFGTFDNLHKGHLYFIKKASKLGNEVIACVARDKNVLDLKKRVPLQTESERIRAVLNLEEVSDALLGDEKLGSYTSVKKVSPDIIALGYDQVELKRDLETWIKSNDQKIKIITLDSFEPEKYKSSILSKI